MQKSYDSKRHTDAFVLPPVERTGGYLRNGLLQINDLYNRYAVTEEPGQHRQMVYIVCKNKPH